LETASVISPTAIEFGPVFFPPSLRWSTVWRTAEGDVWAQTARDHEAFYVRITGFADFRITPATIHVSANATARESTIRHLLLDQVLPLALAGPAGAGKSTLAAALLREGWRVVSDDGLLVEARDGRVCAVPAYSGLRMWADAAEATGLRDSAVSEVAEYSAKVRVTLPHLASPAILKAVYVIETGEQCRVEPLGLRDGAMALIAHAYRAEPENRALNAAQLAACAAAVAQVPVSRVILPRDLARLPGAARALSAHATFAAR
jgi:hypothetical protein